jgi:hypothetical protein
MFRITLMAGDEPQQPAAWPRLQPASAHLQSLHKSLSSRNAIVPLKRVSNTLDDVKKNGQQLLVTAQTALQNGLNDDWALLKRVGTPADARRTSSAAPMRRVASDTNFQRPGCLLVQRAPASTALAAAPTALTREQQRQADAWDWLSALNTTLNQARAAQQSKFTLPSKGQLEEQVGVPQRLPACRCYPLASPSRLLIRGPACGLHQPWAADPLLFCTCKQRNATKHRQPLPCHTVAPAPQPTHPPPPLLLPLPPSAPRQAKQLVHSASSLSLQEVKDQLLQKPKIALNTAAQTLENCQQNLQTLQTSLQTSLQQGLAEGRSTLEKHLSTLGEPGSPSSTANPLAALLSLQRVGSSGALQPAGMEDQATSADGMMPWSLLPAPMRGREAAAIEALVTEDEQEGEDAEASTSGRAWGPFQVSCLPPLLSACLPTCLAPGGSGLQAHPAGSLLCCVCAVAAAATV